MEHKTTALRCQEGRSWAAASSKSPCSAVRAKVVVRLQNMEVSTGWTQGQPLALPAGRQAMTWAFARLMFRGKRTASTPSEVQYRCRGLYERSRFASLRGRLRSTALPRRRVQRGDLNPEGDPFDGRSCFPRPRRRRPHVAALPCRTLLERRVANRPAPMCVRGASGRGDTGPPDAGG